MNSNDYILKAILNLQDTNYRDFQKKLIPNIDSQRIIGVRTPKLKELAKKLAADKTVDIRGFIESLPHFYYEENQLHSFIISNEKDFDKCVVMTDEFLQYIDNWSTCDQLLPTVFKKHKPELLTYIDKWIKSDRTYTVRFAIGMLMKHFLDDDFKITHLHTVSEVVHQDYYVKMMISWYFTTALAKRYDKTVGFLENRVLDKWTHNKTIQKSLESYRISSDKKAYLRTLKI